LQITDSAAQVYYRVLLAQHKDAEARLLAQRIVELHQGRALPVPVLGK
jgi:ABC-type sulfate/molybdate transport systems ATPase subunit